MARLSPREREVLELLVDGLQGPEIAEQLFLSLETVRTHIRNAVGKLGARTRVQAAAMVAVRARGLETVADFGGHGSSIRLNPVARPRARRRAARTAAEA